MHTCDKRHPKSWIANSFPSFTFDKGFTEEVSGLWLRGSWCRLHLLRMNSGLPTIENPTNMSIRGHYQFSNIFGIDTLQTPVSANNDHHMGSTHRSPDVSITAHGGFISALLRVVGRGTYNLPTGGVCIFQQTFFRA